MIPKPNTDNRPQKLQTGITTRSSRQILEKIIYERLRKFLETNSIITDKQHGFRTSRETDTALTTIHETIAHHKARKSQCYCET